ncbi:MAG TPA: sensor histidine kinase [Candidatus Solibacter sp.]|nr:sensor histidine kinase [Candidatus Solibacter sp.]
MRKPFILALVVVAVCIPAMTFVSFVLNAPAVGPAIPLARSVIGGSYLLAGLVAWRARPNNRIGPLMLIAGFAWELTDFNLFYSGDPTDGFFFTLVVLAGPVFIATMAVVVLTFPTGRAETAIDRLLVVAIPMTLLVLQTALALVGGPGQVDCKTCPPDLVAARLDPGLALLATRAVQLITVIGAAAVVGRLGWRWSSASALGRRSLDPVVWSIGPIFVVGVSIRAGELLLPYPHHQLFFAISPLVFVALPLGLVIGLLRTRLDRTGVGRLVVELGDRGRPDELRDTLAKVLHDPSVELLEWSAQTKGFVNSEGQMIALPADGIDRGVTLLERDGQPIGAITHDPLLRDDPDLVRAVASAAQLAVENAQLAAELQQQLAEVEASRARIVTASDDERRRLGRDLHDGAQQRLLALSFAMKAVQRKAGNGDPDIRAAFDTADEQLRLALRELRELAHGIRPPILTEGGLGPALESLAERSAVKVTIERQPQRRFEQPVEAAAYFVVSEALANVAKHAGASLATVAVWQEDGALLVEVRDDGVGGAAAVNGSGLRGLMDRVGALQGRLQVDSPPGKGTRLLAELPCR